MKREVVVTGVGIISAAGSSAAETWQALKAGKSGLSPFSLLPSARYAGIPVGQLPAELSSLSGLERASRPDHLAVIAARQAFKQSFPGAGLPQPEKTGVILGACVGGMAESELFLQRLLLEGVQDTGLLRFHECASSAEAVAGNLGLFGPCETISTACSSGSNAICLAADMILSDEADIMFAGGTDSLSRLTVNGFGSLLLIDPEGCRPFDEERKGMSLGEGAAVLVMESGESAGRRNARVLARLSGWANTCDAYHATAPAPEGDGIQRAIRGALRNAGLSPEDIHYINAHGTATVENDRAEAAAIRSVFGEHTPPVSSTKRVFGHTFAAAGAIEAIVCILAMENQAIPPNAGLHRPDPACPVRIQRSLESADIYRAMSLSLGFGGNNNCLILESPGKNSE
ncbi:MAG TPA: beta-ketoacyl-[acyl-carrier-protein] synthase family protein [Elusimicrobia bacterium]|nr:beta-ketoacyl-[acyl-carrier-protein] synthase family protein [Elusimicrobiota bacterium]